MKFKVLENCISCGLCVELCPSVFSIKDDGLSHAISQNVSKEHEETAVEAMESCPVDAIEKA